MAGFKVTSSTGDIPALISDSTMAELWLPLGGGIMLAALDSVLTSLASDPAQEMALNKAAPVPAHLGRAVRR